MKNFKDTVYSIFLNERRDIIKNKKGQMRMDPDRMGDRATTPEERASNLAFNAEMDRKDAEQDAARTARAKEKVKAKGPQGVKDTSVTSGGVERSLTVPEAQKAADTAEVPNPFGDSSRPDDSTWEGGVKVGLSPNESARFNQFQQNKGIYSAISDGQFRDAENAGKLFNPTTGTWHQGPPRIGGGASTGNRGNSGRSTPGTEGPPPDLRTEAEKEAGAQRAAKLRGDIIREAEALKARQATPEGRRKLDTESRGKIGLGARGQEDWDAMEAVRDKGIAQAKRNKDFKESNAGKAAEHARSEGVRMKGTTSKDRRQAQEDYRLAQVAWEEAKDAAAAAKPASAPAAAPNPNASNGSSDDPTGAASDPQEGPGEPDRRAGTLLGLLEDMLGQGIERGELELLHHVDEAAYSRIIGTDEGENVATHFDGRARIGKDDCEQFLVELAFLADARMRDQRSLFKRRVRLGRHAHTTHVDDVAG